MFLLTLVLTALGIPVCEHSGETIYTDLSGNRLYSAGETLSEQPGSGRNAVSSEFLFWKECPFGEDQLVIRSDGVTVFTEEFFSGPFPAPSGQGFMVSVPGEILVLDSSGSLLESFNTGEYPGSLASGEGHIWFVSSLDGRLRKLDTGTGSISEVPLDFSPTTVDYGMELLLVGRAEGGYSICTTGGNEVHRLENCFMARFHPEGAVSFCRWDESLGCEAVSWSIVQQSLTEKTEVTRNLLSTLEVNGVEMPEDPAIHFDVPYMHQRWDTPDWFNGSWSCGPTSCMMAAQYFNRLTPDSIWCSSPEGHWSQWGNYIPVEYTFLGYTYDILGVSPGSVWVPGSHGFICRDAGGAYWAYMVQWMEQQGLDSSFLGTTWSACTSELSNSWPVVASTTSPFTGGHILLFNGYYDNHSVICNDAYGDQNEPGWGSYYNGKDVVYDWPGYNNGNVQLGISQLFSARSEVLVDQGSLIDDRTLGYRKLGPCQYWHEQTTGYDGYSWWTYSTGALPDTCVVEWIPVLPCPGTYLVETYVPSSHATATGIYHIRAQSGWETAVLNQGNYSQQWVTLGSWYLDPSSAIVRMGDYTGTQGQYISFDAVRFTLDTSTENENFAECPVSFAPQTNPVGSSSPVCFYTPEGFQGEILVYDTAGRATSATDGVIEAGSLSPGIYFAVIKHGGAVFTARFTVTR